MSNYTESDTKALLEFAGVWKAETICPDYGMCETHSLELIKGTRFHYIPMPPLTGDFADVVAMKCRREINTRGFSYVEMGMGYGTQWYFGFGKGWESDGVIAETVAEATEPDPAQAIFAAVLAYLEEQGEGK